MPTQTGFPSSFACSLEPNFKVTCSREKDEEGGLQGLGRSMLLAASGPEPGLAGSTPPHTHSRLTLALWQHTTFTAGKSLAHLTQIPQAVEQALAFPCRQGAGLLRTGQSSAHPCGARLTWHVRPGAPGNRGRSFFCSVTTAVGLQAGSDLPQSPRWYSGQEKGVTTEPLAGPWWVGTQTFCLKSTWPRPPLERYQFNSCLF